MPRYIDLDKALEDVESVGAYYSEGKEVKEECLFELKGQPIADVVPRAEVEKAKQDVAREILGEIEKNLVTINDVDFNRFRCIGARTFAELKKKYIGE